MTPAEMSVLHQAAFETGRAWSEDAFAKTMERPHVHLFRAEAGFALCRTVALETELLTLAVHPDHQRQGVAYHLLKTWLSASRGIAETAFLEVAADNQPARLLYTKAGFQQVGRRTAYYSRANAPAADALFLSLTLSSLQDC
jgi:ribosomal-protein-alanine N-acetyltransferase